MAEREVVEPAPGTLYSLTHAAVHQFWAGQGFVTPEYERLFSDSGPHEPQNNQRAFGYNEARYDDTQVRIRPGEALVAGKAIYKDQVSNVDLADNTAGQVVYAGWGAASADVIIGLESAYPEDHAKLPLWEFETSGGEVVDWTDRRVISPRLATDDEGRVVFSGALAAADGPLEIGDPGLVARKGTFRNAVDVTDEQGDPLFNYLLDGTDVFREDVSSDGLYRQRDPNGSLHFSMDVDTGEATVHAPRFFREAVRFEDDVTLRTESTRAWAVGDREGSGEVGLVALLDDDNAISSRAWGFASGIGPDATPPWQVDAGSGNTEQDGQATAEDGFDASGESVENVNSEGESAVSSGDVTKIIVSDSEPSESEPHLWLQPE